jgi:hypothetical protein
MKLKYTMPTVVAGAVIITASTILLPVSTCGIFASSSIAIQALDAYNYKYVEVVDKTWHAIATKGCSRTDTALFKVRVVNQTNHVRDLYVCSGWPFRGETIINR